MSSSGAHSMSDEQFRALAGIINDRSGVRFPETKKCVAESRLADRLGELGLDDFDQYIAFLTTGPYQGDEFQEMFDRISLNETGFFRSAAQLDVFERAVLPPLLEARSATKRLRVWAAACSSGEEVYTLAMILRGALGAGCGGWEIEILGTDISDRALSAARAGEYSTHAVRGVPGAVRDRWFTEQNGVWRVGEEIRGMVGFETHNLKDRLAAKRHGVWDAIFCRGVMACFDETMKRRVLDMFADQIAPDGALFLGRADSVEGVSTRFGAVPLPPGGCWRPVGESSVRAA